MKTHYVKSWPEFFQSVVDGKKMFELRKDDRNYAVGDNIVLQEWEPNTGKYTGNEIKRLIVYKLSGVGPGAITPLLGLSRGYCILGMKRW